MTKTKTTDIGIKDSSCSMVSVIFARKIIDSLCLGKHYIWIKSSFSWQAFVHLSLIKQSDSRERFVCDGTARMPALPLCWIKMKSAAQLTCGFDVMADRDRL